MPSNTTYNPPNIMSFVKSALNFNAQGVQATAIVGTSTNIDYVLVDDCLLTGVELIVNSGNYGDTMSLEVVDTTGAFTGVVGTVLMKAASNWNVAPISDTQFDLSYPAKVLTGMTLRAVYNSTGATNPFVGINYKLHKCLV